MAHYGNRVHDICHRYRPRLDCAKRSVLKVSVSFLTRTAVSVPEWSGIGVASVNSFCLFGVEPDFLTSFGGSLVSFTQYLSVFFVSHVFGFFLITVAANFSCAAKVEKSCWKR